ncbi:MAG TPA: peptidoglycan-binding protein [Gaiellaceae bacterium]|nr:peptidoglycan-binding protein [Gaiellaceae bacterium]
MRIALTGVSLVLPGTAAAATGAQLFSQSGCAGCHTLAAAGSTGTDGPNLDQLQPSQAAVVNQVTYGGGGMPAFGSTLGSANIATLATWVSLVAGHSGSTAASGVAGLSVAKVKSIQRELAKLGYFHHAVTGVYGPVTTAAVKAFQKAAGLKADGLWGPKTAAAVSKRLG